MSLSVVQKRIVVGILFLAILGTSIYGSFSIGYKRGTEKPQTLIIKGVKDVETNESGIDFSTFWQAWKTVDENYLRYKDLTGERKVNGAIKGLVGALDDPYSIFLPPTDNQKFQEDIQGSFGGVGMEIGIRKNQLMVISPIKDTPAMRAGLRAGDKILRVNASSTDGLSVDQAVKWIRGPVGSTVTLAIYRDGWEEPKDFTIVRDIISAPTLDFEMKEGGIGVIKLYSFNASAGARFYEAALKLLNQGAKGLVLDMRNNPGGYLEVAVDLAGLFVPKGTLVVKEAYRSGAGDEFRASGDAILGGMPVVVLVNQGSASASEILAGALRDIKKIKIVGEQTFGKGTVQQLFDLRDGSSIKLTVANWVMPAGGTLDGVGIKPDVEVKVDDKQLEAGKDPQLDKAIEVLHEEIGKR